MMERWERVWMLLTLKALMATSLTDFNKEFHRLTDDLSLEEIILIKEKMQEDAKNAEI